MPKRAIARVCYVGARMNYIDALPHRPPMRLLDEVADVVPGNRCLARRRTRSGDFFFEGHFPGTPIVPACILVEMIAQAGGIAAVSAVPGTGIELRVAAFGPCKFPAAAGVDAALEIDARVAGHMAGLYKIHGHVHADGVLVASGEVTLASPRDSRKPVDEARASGTGEGNSGAHSPA